MSSRQKMKRKRARLDRATRAYRARLARAAAMQKAIERALARKKTKRNRNAWWRRLLRRLTGGWFG